MLWTIGNWRYAYSCNSLYFYEKKSKNFKFLFSYLGISTGIIISTCIIISTGIIITTGIIISTGITIKLISNDFSTNPLNIKSFMIIGKKI